MASNTKILCKNIGICVHRESRELPRKFVKDAVYLNFMEDKEEFVHGYPIITETKKNGDVVIECKTYKTNSRGKITKTDTFNRTLRINSTDFAVICSNLKYKKGVYSWDENVNYEDMTTNEKIMLINMLTNDLVKDIKGTN